MSSYILIWMLTTFLIEQVTPIAYDASNRYLTTLPADIPTTTDVLRLEFNQLANALLDDLGNFPIVHLNLSSNGFTVFPELTTIGSRLRVLSFRRNQLSTIPQIKVQNLDVLVQLDLAYNGFIIFPDFTPIGDTLLFLDMEKNNLESLEATDVTPLTKLRNLTLDLNENLVIGDISPLSDSLMSLQVSQAKISFQDLFSSFTNLTHLLADIGQETDFPDLSNACASLKTIQMGANFLGDIPSAFLENCHFVEVLRLDSNELTTLPNITAMGNTLKQILISGNRIQTMDQDFMRAQTVLEIVNFENNILTEFPDVSNSAESLMLLKLSDNQIQTVDPAVSGILSSLTIAEMNNNELDEFPDFTGSNASLMQLELQSNFIMEIDASRLSPLEMLTTLNLRNNHLTSIPDVILPRLMSLSLSFNHLSTMPTFTTLGLSLLELHLQANPIKFARASDFIGLENLLLLDLASTQLATIPELHLLHNLQHLDLSNTPLKTASPRAMFRLGRLTTLNLSGTDLKTIPTVCPEPTLNLHLENNSNLDLCSSDMAWLKQDFFTLFYTDIMCTDIGKWWSNATFEELMAIPSVPSPGDIKQLFIGLNMTDTLCRWPTSGTLPSMSWRHCLFACLDLQGCTSFNYHPGTQRCVLVAPTAGEEVPMIDDESGWSFYI